MIRKRTIEDIPVPRYHLVDGNPPECVDIYKKYGKRKFQFVEHCGYIYVANSRGRRYFMSMHCVSNNKEDIEEYIKYLIDLRSDRSLIDLLD